MRIPTAAFDVDLASVDRMEVEVGVGGFTEGSLLVSDLALAD